MAAAALANLEAPVLPAAAHAGRRRLWQLRHQYHCPLIGTCLPITELRRLVRRIGVDPGPMSDYAVHVLAVSHAEERSKLSEILQRTFEDRFATTVRRFAACGDAGAVLACWQDEVAAGNVAGALWAALTHPATDSAVGQLIYGEIHMLSHQVGAENRADLGRMAQLEQSLSALKETQKVERQRMEVRQRELVLRAEKLEQQRQQAQCRAAEFAAEAERQRQAAEAGAESLALARELRRQLELRERRLDGLRSEVTGLRRRLDAALLLEGELRAELATAEAWLADGSGCSSGQEVLPENEQGRGDAGLAGRCLLCIGGREGLVAHYRNVVERQGGRFLHHDGGIEDNPKRLEATLSAADAVMCQAGCVSHAAYWKMKEFCKRHGKQCVYLRRSGITAFVRGLDDLRGNNIPDQHVFAQKQ